jgi:hypothetical protein
MDSVRKKLEDKASVIDCDTGVIVEYRGGLEAPYQSNSDMAFSLEQARERISMLQNFIRDIMVEGVDYGSLPNTDKRCLFKSGAEKLCDIFGFSKKIEIISRVEDFEKGIFHYEVKAILINKRNDQVEAEGVGSCNNMEKKYKTQDAYSVVNTILKMAKKRAFVDAVLSATRSSDIFTQDVEDEGTFEGEKKRTSARASSKAEKGNEKIEMASKKQISYIFTLLSQHRIPVENARKAMITMYNVQESNQLNKNQASEFIEYLKGYNGQSQAG